MSKSKNKTRTRRRRRAPRAKRRPKAAPPRAAIDSWDDVDRLLARLAEIDARRDKIQSDADERIRAIRAEVIEAASSLSEERKVLVKEIEAFAKGRRRDFGHKRSLALAHGRVGWRQSQQIRFIRKAEEVVAALEAKGLDLAVMVTKRASKETMETFDDDLLAEVGAKRVRRHKFFVELAETSLGKP